MTKAAFALDKYIFNLVDINLSNKKSSEIDISFLPSGKFDPKTSSFILTVEFTAITEKAESPFVKIECESHFKRL